MGDADSIRQKIIEELLEASESDLDASEIKPETNLRDDLGLDSLGSTELRTVLAQRLGIPVPPSAVQPKHTLAEVIAGRAEIVAAVRGVGYRYVTLDLEGFRSGNLNTALG